MMILLLLSLDLFQMFAVVYMVLLWLSLLMLKTTSASAHRSSLLCPRSSMIAVGAAVFATVSSRFGLIF
jgi:hypothetical protein